VPPLPFLDLAPRKPVPLGLYLRFQGRFSRLPAEPRPEASASLGGRSRDLGFRALMGEKGGQLPVLVPALLLRLVQPSPEV